MATEKFELPEGYELSVADIEAFWDEEQGAIEGKLLGAKIVETKFGPNYLFSIELLQECIGRKTEKEEESVLLEPGQIMGVWAKPGMRALKRMQGCRVFIARAGEKDTGKGNPMKLYKIGKHKEDKPAELVITEDTRQRNSDPNFEDLPF